MRSETLHYGFTSKHTTFLFFFSPTLFTIFPTLFLKYWKTSKIWQKFRKFTLKSQLLGGGGIPPEFQTGDTSPSHSGDTHGYNNCPYLSFKK